MKWLQRHLNPITMKRLRRFRRIRRAYWSLLLLLTLLILSLGAELLCNNRPLFVRFKGKAYFPAFRFYPDDTFTGSGRMTRPDYKLINESAEFSVNQGNFSNFMIFPLVPHSPYEIAKPERLQVPDIVTVKFRQEPRLASIDVLPDLSVARSVGGAFFLGVENDFAAAGTALDKTWELPEPIQAGIADRFANQPAAAVTERARNQDGGTAQIGLGEYRPRSAPPRTVRLRFNEVSAAAGLEFALNFAADADAPAADPRRFWEKLDETVRAEVLSRITERRSKPINAFEFSLADTRFRAEFYKEDIRFPFRPLPGHWLGLDSAGRDVLARIFYGLRISLIFGLILVSCSVCLGIIIGSIQGYFGGRTDILTQRFIEVWSALPFLYVMILMGSVYGRGFMLLLFCYALFNWIGMSYYMRAEFLRLRGLTFVEAAKCLGLPTWRILVRHILPNALVPVITFLPFSLVGAIGSLAALDYLGFGLPPPTPSWGELLHQAQQFRWAWWLILYPSLALFTVMLLGVFVGEGVREAYDPRRFARLE